jgi:aldehyde:ferredoxin oxidoreductase
LGTHYSNHPRKVPGAGARKSMMNGYTGNILHVDLTARDFKIESPDEGFYRNYIGGSALGLYYLLKLTPPNTDPLGPNNTLIFALSGTVGAPISGQSRATVVAKSPLTDAVGDSQAGGFWPAELKFAGFDALVIRGVASSPVYLWIKDGQFELRDASHLWGQTTREAESLLVREIGDDRIEVAQIGPAGEKLVRFAAIINMSNRAHGRTGMGAVMGSKLLKAIVVRGTRKYIKLSNPKKLLELTKQGTKTIPEDGDMLDLSKYGTAGIVGGQNMAGGLVTRNWQSGFMEIDRAEAISGEYLYNNLLRGTSRNDQHRMGRDTCYSCAVRCKRVVESEWRGRPIHPASGGPEYETISTFGSYCDIDDLIAISFANQLCNQYGVDTIAAGATMAFAIECFENGLITEEDTQGVSLAWGDSQAMLRMLEMTVRRQGFGDVLAEGTSRAAEWIGKGASKLVVAVKKQDIPAHMPHVKRSLALIYAVNPFGADHQSSEHDPAYEPDFYRTNYEKYGRRLTAIGLTNPQDEKTLNPEKVEFALQTQYAYSALDTADVCQFVFGPAWQLYGMQELAEMITAVTGWEMTIDELLLIGRRRLNMLRAFNAREGITRESDTLPKRFFDRPLQGGPSDGIIVNEGEFKGALSLYYERAGWNPQTGFPHPETLRELGLDWIPIGE